MKNCGFPLWVCFLVCSCASPQTFVSQLSSNRPVSDGITYSLPLALIEASLEVKGDRTVSSSITRKLVPGPTSYSLSYRSSVLATDDFKISTGGNGLLDSASTTTVDISPQIVEQISEGFSGILRRSTDETVMGDADVQPIKTVALLNPYRPGGHFYSRSGFTARILDLEGRPLYLPSASPVLCPRDGICFPMLKPAIVRLQYGETFVSEEMLLIPDVTSLGYVDIRRAPCVETVATLTLQDGIVSNFDQNRGSVVAGCLSIRLDIISAIIRAPIDAILGRGQRISADKDLLDAQKDLITSQANLIKQRQLLEDLEVEGTPSDPVAPAN